ncbi:MAG TPA: TylF/MycF family methyltransferase [Gemmataceae bacterium]|nr:TylF/MycF family methyltransferase [Gemmataceae bacterium]
MTNLYLDLMEKCLLNTIYEDAPNDPWTGGKYNPELRAIGKDWPSRAHTMIGYQRLHQLREACETVLSENIPGDFIETGVWRGGACILMRAVLKAYGVTDRKVWCADSFAGLPKPDAAHYPSDYGDPHHTYSQLVAGLDDVKSNFMKYDLLDDQVGFLVGWFKDTLPCAPIDKLAILRLDGDMYESTIQGLDALYDKVSPGGFVIVDDYWVVPACRAAVHDYRARKDIGEEIVPIDWGGVFWRKQ